MTALVYYVLVYHVQQTSAYLQSSTIVEQRSNKVAR